MLIIFWMKNLLDKVIKFRSMILPDLFIDHDKPDNMYKVAGLDSLSIENKVIDTLNSKIVLKKLINFHTVLYSLGSDLIIHSAA